MRFYSTICAVLLSASSFYAQDRVATKNLEVPQSFPTILELTKGDVINALSLKAYDGSLIEAPTLIYCPKITHRAIFCRMEDKMVKSAKLPVKIRLGDVQYTDKLEGKNAFDRFSLPN